MSEDGYFENYLQYIVISTIENFASLRTPVDKSVYDSTHQLWCKIVILYTTSIV